MSKIKAVNELLYKSPIFWIGGSPCAGKSSVGEALAARYGLPVYHCDEFFEKHQAQATPEAQPLLALSKAMSWEEIWLGRSIETQVEQEFQIYDEEFELILVDLAKLPQRPLIIEGTALLPQKVLPLLGDRRQAVWLVPTEEFQRAFYAKREWAQEIIKQTSRPAQAFENWMVRDARFAEQVVRQAQRLDLRIIKIDVTRTLEQTVAEVESQFKEFLGLPDVVK